MRYVCTFEDDGGNQVAILSSEVASEATAILEVAARLKELAPDRTWSPLYSEVHFS